MFSISEGVKPSPKTLIQLFKNAFYADSKAKTYNYVMTHQTKCFHDAVFGPEVLQKAPFCQCDHGDDILYTMGIPMMEKKLTFDMKFTDDEKKLSKEWIKYIVNFAKNG